MSSENDDAARRKAAIAEYRKKMLNHKELDVRVRSARDNLRATKKEYAKTEDDLKSLQSVGQIIGEVLRPLDNERLIVKASSGPRYVVGCRNKVDILKIHASGIAKHSEIDYEAVVKLAEGFNGADLRNICTEAGMAAIRAERDYVIHEDFMKAVRKLNDAKKLESSAHYSADFGKE